MVKAKPLMGSTVMPSGNHSPLHLTLVRSPPERRVFLPLQTPDPA
jgi:hypothetical protein